jgi:hypothetical protein
MSACDHKGIAPDAESIALREEIAKRRFERLLDTLDLHAAAALLFISACSLGRMAKAGKVPATKVGRKWVFSARLLQEWLDARCLAGSRARQQEADHEDRGAAQKIIYKALSRRSPVGSHSGSALAAELASQRAQRITQRRTATGAKP